MTIEILDLIEERRLQKENKEENTKIKKIVKSIDDSKENRINEQSKDMETLERKHGRVHLHNIIKLMTHTYKLKTPAKLMTQTTN